MLFNSNIRKSIFLIAGLFVATGLIFVWHSQFDAKTKEQNENFKDAISSDGHQGENDPIPVLSQGESTIVVGKQLMYSTILDGGRVGVFSKNLETSEVTLVFDFLPLGSMTPEYAVAMSFDSRRFAYIDEMGLHLRNVVGGNDTVLIRKKNGYAFGFNKAVHWSIDGMDSVDSIEQPEFSPDGRRIMFDQKHKDGSFACGVLEIGSNVVVQAMMESGSFTSCIGTHWSPDGNFLVKSEYDIDSANGLFLSDGSDIEKMRDIRESLGHPTADFYETAVHSDGKRIAVLYKENYESDDTTLAIYNKDENNLKVLSDAGEKSNIFFSADGNETYYVKTEENQSSLISRSTDTGEKKYSVMLPERNNVWSDFQWIDNEFLFFVGDSVDETSDQLPGKSQAFLFDVNRKEMVYSSIVSDNAVRVLGIVTIVP